MNSILDHQVATMTTAKALSLIVAIILFAHVGLAAGESSTRELTESQQVLAVERAWIDAEVSHDEAVLNRVLDDRFVLNSSSGTPGTKAALIAAVLQMNMVSQTLTDQAVLVDGDTAVVMGTAHFTFAVEGKDNATSASRYITTYIKRDGQWRALALQMNTIDSE